jgi:hypothetical protein
MRSKGDGLGDLDGGCRMGSRNGIRGEPDTVDERVQLLAEFARYRQLADCGTFDHKNDWSGWLADHPLFADYEGWEETLSPTDQTLAFLMDDEDRIRWYLGDRPREGAIRPFTPEHPAPPMPVTTHLRGRSQVAKPPLPPRVELPPRPLQTTLPAIPQPPRAYQQRATPAPTPRRRSPAKGKQGSTPPRPMWEELLKVAAIVAVIIWALWYLGTTNVLNGGGYSSGTNAYDDDPAYNAGCGTRGGPGYRLPNGKCASWSEYYNIRYGR